MKIRNGLLQQKLRMTPRNVKTRFFAEPWLKIHGLSNARAINLLSSPDLLGAFIMDSCVVEQNNLYQRWYRYFFIIVSRKADILSFSDNWGLSWEPADEIAAVFFLDPQSIACYKLWILQFHSIRIPTISGVSYQSWPSMSLKKNFMVANPKPFQSIMVLRSFSKRASWSSKHGWTSKADIPSFFDN